MSGRAWPTFDTEMRARVPGLAVEQDQPRARKSA